MTDQPEQQETELLTAEIEREHRGMRLDAVLAELFPDWSRSQLQKWVKSDRVTLNGKPCRTRDKLAVGDRIEMQPALDVVQTEYEAEVIDLDVVYEDDSIIVINKPAGLVVHPGAGNWQGTLLNGLLHRYPELDALPRAGIVHRLDKATSGVMVVARTLKAHKSLVSALQERTVHRRYVALAQGEFVSGGTIEAPIGRHSSDRKKMAVTFSGKEAITHYRVQERLIGYTLLDVRLETGRTHQIRVHMAHSRHPLIGDPAYGGRPRLPKGVSDELRQAIVRFPRQALHAYELGLVHPETEEEMKWSVPIPEDLQDLINIFRAEGPPED